jgi:hypothetical protein
MFDRGLGGGAAMIYAFSHWHAGWHAIISIGSVALWLLSCLVVAAWMPSGADRLEAEKRGRKISANWILVTMPNR